MNPEELKQQIDFLRNELEDLRFFLNRKLGSGSADVRANIIAPSTVGGDVTLGDGAISSASMFAAAVVDQTAIGANAIGQSEWKEEEATLAFGSGDTSQTASVTSG